MAGELISVVQMRAIDARAAELGVPTRVLMENAGAAAAAGAVALWPAARFLVLCGPGNNGGDGFVAARILQEAGRKVRVALIGERAALRGDAALAAKDWNGPIERAVDVTPDAGEAVVDALFGAGLSRPLDGEAAALIARIMTCDAPVLAVDTPSGLPGDGAPPQGPVLRADATVTFVRKKPAHVLEPGRTLCGRVSLADIGVPEAAVAAQDIRLWLNGPELWRLPWPGREAHKHARGHVMAVSGGLTQTGAIRLAARAALRAGAGLVTILSPPSALSVHAAHLTAIMLSRFDDSAALAAAAEKASALLIGPAAGIDSATRDNVLALAALKKPMVLDADAFTVFADAPERLFSLLPANSVLTPHLGEFRRLAPDVADSSGSKIEKAKALAARAGAVVLLKGPDTVIAAADGRAVVNEAGTPFLASAGSGDVLAGIIVALAAGGMPAFEAACAGAWLHGKAGEAVGPGLIAEDLPEALMPVLAELHGADGGSRTRTP